MNGIDFILYSNNNPVAASTECGVKLSCAVTEISTKADGYSKYLPKRIEGEATAKGMVDLSEDYNLEYLYEFIESKSPVLIRIGTDDWYIENYAFVTKVSSKADSNDVARYDASFKFNGNIVYLTDDFGTLLTDEDGNILTV